MRGVATPAPLREEPRPRVRTATGRTDVYSLGTTPLREADDWLARYRAAWPQRLDALDTEPLWEAASSAPAAG